jgi:hypothetical protein
MKNWLPATNNWGKDAGSREAERIHDETGELRLHARPFRSPTREKDNPEMHRWKSPSPA